MHINAGHSEWVSVTFAQHLEMKWILICIFNTIFDWHSKQANCDELATTPWKIHKLVQRSSWCRWSQRSILHVPALHICAPLFAGGSWLSLRLTSMANAIRFCTAVAQTQWLALIQLYFLHANPKLNAADFILRPINLNSRLIYHF